MFLPHFFMVGQEWVSINFCAQIFAINFLAIQEWYVSATSNDAMKVREMIQEPNS